MTNNNPAVIAHYYLKSIYQASRRYYRDHKLSINIIMPWPTGLPSVIRSDHGTEKQHNFLPSTFSASAWKRRIS